MTNQSRDQHSEQRPDAPSYNSIFPPDAPPDPDDARSVAEHDRKAFAGVFQMLNHWDRPHRRSYHWMLTFEQHPEVADLAERCQRDLPAWGLDLIPPDYLHVTLRRLGYVDQIADGVLDTAVQTVREECAAGSAFRLRIIPLAGSPGAVRFSVAPWKPLLGVYRAISLASGHHRADPLTTFRPHLGIAYSNQNQSATPIVTATHHALRHDAIEITVSDIKLVELYRTDRGYQWRVLAVVPLARQNGVAADF